MKFFNIDLHIGVIGDIRDHLTLLGHTVHDLTLSDHSWVLGRPKDDVAIINSANWRQIDQAMCDAFYAHYKDELAQYDAFIVTHTPCFAMLFEKWRKPIIVVASTRYEHPFTGAPDRWRKFNDFLRTWHSEGLLIPLSNNLYDGAYAEHFTGFKWPTIPSFCSYTHMNYNPGREAKWCKRQADPVFRLIAS